MKCKKCKNEMETDIWSGWRWTCSDCEITGRELTPKELEALGITEEKIAIFDAVLLETILRLKKERENG